jgi:hypothetical protein
MPVRDRIGMVSIRSTPSSWPEAFGYFWAIS